MPANREWLAYGSVAIGAGMAVVLIRWMPPVPVSAVSRPVAAPKMESPAVPPDLIPEKKESESTSLLRRDIFSSRSSTPPTLERRVPAVPPRIEKKPAARSLPVPAARPAVRKDSPAAVTEMDIPAAPVSAETVPQQSPPPRIELPMPVVAPRREGSGGVGLRAKIGDVTKFKEKVQGIASQFSATVVFKESIRIEVSADRRAALKSALDRAIFEFLSDDGSDIQIELVSP